MRLQAVMAQERTKAAAEKQVMASIMLAPRKGPTRDRIRQTIRPGTGMPFWFCRAKMAGITLPRAIPMSRLAEAMKKPFQVVSRPARAPMVMSQ